MQISFKKGFYPKLSNLILGLTAPPGRAGMYPREKT